MARECGPPSLVLHYLSNESPSPALCGRPNFFSFGKMGCPDKPGNDDFRLWNAEDVAWMARIHGP